VGQVPHTLTYTPASTPLKTSAPCQSRFCFGNLGRLHQFWWPAGAMGTPWRSWFRFEYQWTWASRLQGSFAQWDQ
jgi:hypothetical protein